MESSLYQLSPLRVRSTDLCSTYTEDFTNQSSFVDSYSISFVLIHSVSNTTSCTSHSFSVLCSLSLHMQSIVSLDLRAHIFHIKSDYFQQKFFALFYVWGTTPSLPTQPQPQPQIRGGAQTKAVSFAVSITINLNCVSILTCTYFFSLCVCVLYFASTHSLIVFICHLFQVILISMDFP